MEENPLLLQGQSHFLLRKKHGGKSSAPAKAVAFLLRKNKEDCYGGHTT